MYLIKSKSRHQKKPTRQAKRKIITIGEDELNPDITNDVSMPSNTTNNTNIIILMINPEQGRNAIATRLFDDAASPPSSPILLSTSVNNRYTKYKNVVTKKHHQY